MLAYQLLRPLSYLTIRDPSKKNIDFFVPLFLSLVSVAVYILLPIKPQIFMVGGLVEKLQGILQILPGFYIAALAAIATFNKEGMDRYMPPPTPEVDIKTGGQTLAIKLTRRRFSSIMFGYLAFLCIFLYIFCLLSNVLAPNIEHVTPSQYHRPVKYIFIFLLSFGFWQLVTVTLFGLYQLSDRMHQPDPE